MNWRAAQSLLGVAADGVPGPQTFRALATALTIPLSRRKLLTLRLTPNFSLFEMTYSATATGLGRHNMPNAQQLAAMVYLCETILEPVRAQFGAVTVTSGFRGFTPNSQHGKGEAADFEVRGVDNKLVAQWIISNLRYDQLIFEAWSAHDPNAGWIHCSATKRQERRSVLRTPTGRAPYLQGLGYGG